MKKFVWRLQRLLDIKIRQEQLARTELIALSEQIAALHAEILMHKASIRARLMEMRTLASEERIEQQRHFMQFAHVLDMRIQSLNDKLAILNELRKERLAQLLELRKERKSLEKLRTKAKDEHHRQWIVFEQKSTDETSGTAFTRRHILSRQHAELAEQMS